MQRRHFLKAGLGFAALGLSGLARADAYTTYQRFHAALARDPELTVYANLEGNQQGHAHVEGRIPGELQGTFFRNGPGRFELGGERYHHWFDGDGYAQAWCIDGGTVTHQGRFVETRKFLDESAAGQFLYPAFGTDIARRGFRDNDSLNTANTNLLPFNDRLYALWEGGSATELDPATLATIGIHTWRDDLAAMPFSAHPKVEPDGTLWNFGALPGGDKLALYRIGADGKVRQAGVIDVPKLALQHDFAVSARHLVFLVPPYDISDDKNLSLADRHVWAAEKRGARIVVVAKDTLTIRRVYDLPPRMAFHFGNAWDEAGGNVTQVDLVLHDGDLLKAASRVMEGEREPNRPALHAAVRISLDHASGKVSTTRLLDGAEFPRVMPQVVGRRHGRLAMLSSDARNTSLMLDTVNVVDVERGRADSWRFAPGWRAEEHVLVPRKGARSETDGWLVGVAQDTNTATSVLSVFDAARVAAGPVALARLPYRTPHCFHGNFLAA
ncbi:carotenoid oxygenase family protein [Telluria mixta]|uniref:Carotenoid oxygenase family protein n=1 Tax=Telluria mixta TaxID=34071 RepID=A0ABT2C0E7_9BURK|nr:carotenoid oxygenase family protein [Telluria mixta]MCS0630840.1 carotenoid oxygenase family protein [Telluria mixta]WEM98841.1 carotenoid oxygenase family protein [Telluria mixta]